MWKVVGIKIERTRAQNFFCGQTKKSVKTEFFTLRPVTRKRMEILGWAIKGQMGNEGLDGYWIPLRLLGHLQC